MVISKVVIQGLRTAGDEVPAAVVRRLLLLARDRLALHCALPAARLLPCFAALLRPLADRLAATRCQFVAPRATELLLEILLCAVALGRDHLHLLAD